MCTNTNHTLVDVSLLSYVEYIVLQCREYIVFGTCESCVPLDRINKQKFQRVVNLRQSLAIFSQIHSRTIFFDQYVTMDETWLQSPIDPQSNGLHDDCMNWVLSVEGRGIRLARLWHSVLGCVMIFINYLKKGHTISSDYIAIWRKKVLFHQDHAVNYF